MITVCGNYASCPIATSPGSAIYARKNIEVSAVFLFICSLSTLSFNTSGDAFKNPWSLEL